MVGLPFAGGPATLGGWILHLSKAGGAFSASASALCTSLGAMVTAQESAVGILLAMLMIAIAMAPSFAFSSRLAGGDQEDATQQKSKPNTSSGFASGWSKRYNADLTIQPRMWRRTCLRPIMRCWPYMTSLTIISASYAAH
eukprot:4388934-Amphidinium_carterae.1